MDFGTQSDWLSRRSLFPRADRIARLHDDVTGTQRQLAGATQRTANDSGRETKSNRLRGCGEEIGGTKRRKYETEKDNKVEHGRGVPVD